MINQLSVLDKSSINAVISQPGINLLYLSMPLQQPIPKCDHSKKRLQLQPCIVNDISWAGEWLYRLDLSACRSRGENNTNTQGWMCMNHHSVLLIHTLWKTTNEPSPEHPTMHQCVPVGECSPGLTSQKIVGWWISKSSQRRRPYIYIDPIFRWDDWV